jgi:hypothetical protein
VYNRRPGPSNGCTGLAVPAWKLLIAKNSGHLNRYPRPATRALAYVSHLSRASPLSALRRMAVGVALGTAMSASAAVVLAARTLPGDATFAEDAQFSYPYVKAGKQILRLAPGARIYNDRNLIIMPGTVPAKATVLFKTDINGQISRVWILTDEEAKAYEDKK